MQERILSVCCALRLIRNGAQKLLGVLITVGEAVAYVVSGMYGDVRELGAGNAILIIVQARAHLPAMHAPVHMHPISSSCRRPHVPRHACKRTHLLHTAGCEPARSTLEAEALCACK
jgi:hypothetical protein